MSRFGKSLFVPAVLVGLSAVSNGFGATVDLRTLLNNVQFTAGNGPADPGTGVGCPISWTCGGSPAPGFTSYTPTSAQYTAGSDGLAPGLFAPNGAKVATSPTNVEGSGSLAQSGLGTYVNGNTYALDFWLGTPKTLPIDGTTPAGAVGTITIYFMGNGGAVLDTISFTAPAVGQWAEHLVSYTPTGAAIGQSIGFELFIDSQPVGGGSGNNRIINFDPAPLGSTAPEPTSLLLGGLGIASLGLLKRFRSSAN